MKIGDTLAVQIEGMDVAQAYIEDIVEGNAVIVIPATRLVVQVRQSLDLSATREPEVDRILAGVKEPEETPTPAPKAPDTLLTQGRSLREMELDSSAID